MWRAPKGELYSADNIGVGVVLFHVLKGYLMRNKKNNLLKGIKVSRGFTLTEILVVVVILVVLATIAVTVMSGQISKSRESAAKIQLANLADVLNRGQLTRGTATLSDNTITVTDNLGGISTAEVGAASVFTNDGAQLGGLNNLLSSNQATPTTLGGYSRELLSENPAGTYTRTAASGWVSVSAATAIPVTPGTAYTLRNRITARGAGMRVLLQWQNSSGTAISNLFGNTINSGASGVSSATDVAPATAAKAKLFVMYSAISSGVVGDNWTMSEAGFWEGSTTVWLPPGKAAGTTLNFANGTTTWCIAAPNISSPGNYWRQKSTESEIVSVPVETAYLACS